MKITSFNPIYGTTNLDEATSFFEKLGFQKIHTFTSDHFSLYTMENEAGKRVDITCNDYVVNHKIDGLFATRMNVDDMDEALNFFAEQGAEVLMPRFQEGDSREVATVKTKNGDIYSVVHHLK